MLTKQTRAHKIEFQEFKKLMITIVSHLGIRPSGNPLSKKPPI